MAAFGLSKLPFFSSRRPADDGDAAFEDTGPDKGKRAGEGRPQSGATEQLPELAPPVVGKREKQIDGQAIRRPQSGASALEGGFLSLAGIREHYMAEEPEAGRFVIRNLGTGKEVSISGIDYIQFADLTVSCAFLTRSNPENLILPPPTQAGGTQGNIHDLTMEVAAAIDEGLLAEQAADDEVAASESAGGEADAAQDRGESAAAAAGAITITEAELLAGAGDDAAASLRIVKIACGGDGRIEDNGDRSWSFHPTEGFNGEVALELTIRDKDGEETSVEAVLTIEADDDKNAPSAAAPETTAPETVAPETVAPETIAPETPPSDAPEMGDAPEMDEAQVAAETAAAADAIIETPPERFEAPATPIQGEASLPTDEAPLPEPASPRSAASQETPAPSRAEDLIVKVSELIGEDFEGQDVRLHGFTQPDNGRLVDNGDGTLSFTPHPAWGGSTTFTYSVIDDAGKITSCTLIVELDPDEAPETQAPHETQAPLETQDILETQAPPVTLPADLPQETAVGPASLEADLYAGARYEDIDVDEEDRPIGAGAAEMIAVTQGSVVRHADSEAPTAGDPAEETAGDILAGLKADAADRPLDSAAETPKKPKKRSKNAEAAEALFKQLDW